MSRAVDTLALRAAVLAFLAGAKAGNQMYNGRTAREAFEAACALFDCDPARVERALLPTEAE